MVHGGIVDVAGGVRPHARGRPEDMRKPPWTHMTPSPHTREDTRTDAKRNRAEPHPPQPLTQPTAPQLGLGQLPPSHRRMASACEAWRRTQGQTACR